LARFVLVPIFVDIDMPAFFPVLCVVPPPI
jgi:hypothetical protein